MEQKKNSKFDELLKKRRELSQKNVGKVKKVSAEDSQLRDIIKNFNEEKKYKKVM